MPFTLLELIGAVALTFTASITGYYIRIIYKYVESTFTTPHVLDGNWFGRWSEFRREFSQEIDETMIRKKGIFGSKYRVEDQTKGAIEYSGRLFILYKQIVLVFWTGSAGSVAYRGMSLAYINVQATRIQGFWVGPSLAPDGGGAMTIGPWVSGRTPEDREEAWNELHQKMALTLERFTAAER